MATDLPEVGVAISMSPASSCAVCREPCFHEGDTGIPWPGAYIEATLNHPEHPAVPVCDKCVQAHYPEKVAEVEADRLHYWTH
ncbi:MAG: hypothetical protein WKF94_18705 [Solirubrobacteraceae bacterium]